MAWVPAAAGIVAGVSSLLSGSRDAKRQMEQMQRQHEAAMARLRNETIEQIKQAKDAAVKEYRQKLIRDREEYPRPKYLPDDDVPTIGIIGESGVGKSTFINAVLGKCVAKTGVFEQTGAPELYEWGGLRLVDLPGGCTEKFKAEDYFQRFGIKFFDTVVCLNTDARLKKLALDAVQHLTRNDIPTLFVLTKMDSVIKGERITGEVIRSEEEVLEEIDQRFNAALSEYHCPVFFISVLDVLEECGSYAAVPQRVNPLTRRINKDWQPLLQVMAREAIARKKLILGES